MKKFHHFGAVLTEKREDMGYVEAIKVWGTDSTSDFNKVEYLYFEPDSPLLGTPVSEGGHVAYQVCDVDAMTADKKCIFGPETVMPGTRIAFFVDENGLLTEYAQFG